MPPLQILLAHPDDPVRPAAWWGERQVVARRLLAAGNPELAYRLVAAARRDRRQRLFRGRVPAAATSRCASCKDPALAFDHFARILARVDHALRQGAGRLLGRPRRRSAGQVRPRGEMVRRRGRAHGDLLRPARRASARQRRAAASGARAAARTPPSWPASTRNELVRAAQLFFAARRPRRTQASSCCSWPTRRRRRSISRCSPTLAEAHGRIDLAIAVARRAIDAGMPLMVHGYPVTALPGGGTAERPLLFAIVRQESAFEPDAMSRSGRAG